ncbi:hypothetical protein ACF07Q_18465 [Nocardiopsis dassonvillei]|uniref:hypothetical protein n=1 Tax=Nocardiopsis dassonvillei TaxID=2014 RepID=UPI0036FCCFA0
MGSSGLPPPHAVAALRPSRTGPRGRYVPIDHADWDVQTSAGVLATGFDSIDEIEWSDGEGSTANAVHNFLEAFGDNSSKWEKVSY